MKDGSTRGHDVHHNMASFCLLMLKANFVSLYHTIKGLKERRALSA